MLDFCAGGKRYPDHRLPANQRLGTHKDAIFCHGILKTILSVWQPKLFEDDRSYRGFWGKFNQTKNFPDIAGKQIRAYFDFKTNEGEK